MDLESKIKAFLVDIVDVNFLESVEKWARFDGEEFDIGDIDLSIRNMGTFSKKASYGSDNIFDVTMIKDNATCATNHCIILIAERYAECWETLNSKQNHLPKLYIYSIDNGTSDEDYSIDDSEYTPYPSFERLKKDFEKGNYTVFRNLLHEFCGKYQLGSYNDNSNSLMDFQVIHRNLKWLSQDEESIEIYESLPTIPRIDNMLSVDLWDLLEAKLGRTK